MFGGSASTSRVVVGSLGLLIVFGPVFMWHCDCGCGATKYIKLLTGFSNCPAVSFGGASEVVGRCCSGARVEGGDSKLKLNKTLAVA